MITLARLVIGALAGCVIGLAFFAVAFFIGIDRLDVGHYLVSLTTLGTFVGLFIAALWIIVSSLRPTWLSSGNFQFKLRDILALIFGISLLLAIIRLLLR
jgi:hypothetical protein